VVVPPDSGDWVAVTVEPLAVGPVADWVARPDCGAVVTFSGTVRDHSEGRPGVVTVEYEAYEDYVGPRLAAVAAEARRGWPELGRVALLHRVGLLPVSAVSVVVAVSTPHRAEAFAAGRFCIDTLKETVPVWKLETWSGGSAWAGPCGVRA
jgi:molybdopterin synthase catalytic subunit